MGQLDKTLGTPTWIVGQLTAARVHSTTEPSAVAPDARLSFSAKQVPQVFGQFSYYDGINYG
jgi:hypothetical protein